MGRIYRLPADNWENVLSATRNSECVSRMLFNRSCNLNGTRIFVGPPSHPPWESQLKPSTYRPQSRSVFMREETRVEFGRNRFGTIPPRRISWSAILAGVAVALGVSILLGLLGAGLGAGSVNPTREQNPMQGLGIGALIWMVVSGIIAFFAGGWVAGYASGWI